MSPIPMRLEPSLRLPFSTARAPQSAKDREQRRQHVEPVRGSELPHVDHDVPLTPVAVEPEPLAQLLHHGQVRLLPSVVSGCAVPVHGRHRGAVRVDRKAARLVVGRGAQRYILAMAEHCQKCNRRNVVTFTVEPEEAWRTVVLNRWRVICPSCFDQEAERAGVRYSFANLEGMSWSDRPPPRNPCKRKR